MNEKELDGRRYRACRVSPHVSRSDLNLCLLHLFLSVAVEVISASWAPSGFWVMDQRFLNSNPSRVLVVEDSLAESVIPLRASWCAVCVRPAVTDRRSNKRNISSDWSCCLPVLSLCAYYSTSVCLSSLYLFTDGEVLMTQTILPVSVVVYTEQLAQRSLWLLFIFLASCRCF